MRITAIIMYPIEGQVLIVNEWEWYYLNIMCWRNENMAATNQETYDFIKTKVDALKKQYTNLLEKSDDYVFNALVVKAVFYKNPAYEVTGKDLDDIIVDGHGDGGVDVLLADPSSETSDLIIGQSKFYKTITFDDCENALNKMIDFFIEMSQGHYESVNQKVRQRYLFLDGDVGEESKIVFLLCTSAPQNNIRIDRLKKYCITN